VEALEAVLRDIDNRGISEIRCLGDVVGYGADPNECTDLLRERGIFGVRGNHDMAAVSPKYMQGIMFREEAKISLDWTREQLKPENKAYLAGLAKVVSIPAYNMILLHGSYSQPFELTYITSATEPSLSETFSRMQRQDICFVGHTHVPALFIGPDNIHELVPDPEADDIFELDPGKYVINPGSVGQPRYGKGISYAIMEQGKVTFVGVNDGYNPYDPAAKIIRAGLPDILGLRLIDGGKRLNGNGGRQAYVSDREFMERFRDEMVSRNVDYKLEAE
jgi:predicted phosphodiesterase